MYTYLKSKHLLFHLFHMCQRTKNISYRKKKKPTYVYNEFM